MLSSAEHGASPSASDEVAVAVAVAVAVVVVVGGGGGGGGMAKSMGPDRSASHQTVEKKKQVG